MGAVIVNEFEVVGAGVSSVREAISDAESDELTGSVNETSRNSGAEVVSAAIDAESSLIGAASEVVDFPIPADVASEPVTVVVEVVVVVSRAVTGPAVSGIASVTVTVMSPSVAVESGDVAVRSVVTGKFVRASVGPGDPVGPTVTV